MVHGFCAISCGVPLRVRMSGIGDRLEEMRVPRSATDILRWAGHPSGNAARHVSSFVQCLLDYDVMLPVVPEIVGVAESLADLCSLAQQNARLVERGEQSSGSGTP